MTTSFQFANPWFLLLLLVLPLLWLLLRNRRGPANYAALRFSDVSSLQGGGRSMRQRLRWLPTILRVLVMAAMILGLARPQWVQAREIVSGEGVDIALALDISGSMAALDFEPQNRLEAAKSVIGDFIDERTHDRIGLVIFAADAFHQSPPTVDHRVLKRLLDETRLAPELGIADGTAIGMGVANAANMLKNSTAASRIVILITDGVNNAGQIDPATAAAAAKALGIRVYTIGMGRPGPVPVRVPDLYGGSAVIMQESALDLDSLQKIADTTGGQFFRADNPESLRAIYDEIDRLERSEYEVEMFTESQELAGMVMVPALLLLLAELFLRQSWLRTLP